ncbi:MAG TPA: glutathione S-transferase family protein [Stellaceae bacterium]|nr:glutathione S-transferase family protein [Stellaceae bacterium]
MTLELYHAEPRANSLKPVAALLEKGLTYTSHYVDLLNFEQHEPWFVKINPNGQVPVLVHDGAVITESSVINEYLDDVFPEKPLRPADPAERARMRVFVKFTDEYAFPAFSIHGWHRMVRRVAKAVPPDRFEKLLERIPLKEQRDKWATVAGDSFSQDQLDEATRKIGVFCERLETALTEHEWTAGSTYSLSDICAFCLAPSAKMFWPQFCNPEKTPRTIAWIERIEARPAIKAAMSGPDRTAATLAKLAEA